MITTFTANPSVDRSAALPGPLSRGAVLRLAEVHDEPGGKGVNVARVVTMAGVAATAVLPVGSEDPLHRLLDAAGVGYAEHRTAHPVRTNLTITEPDGTTTKLNEPGAPLRAEDVAALETLLLERTTGSRWAALCGSLPPGAPTDWYARLVPQLRAAGVSVAVDTSDAPLLALAEAGPQAAPDLLKPNAEELTQLGGGDPEELEAAAAAGDLRPTVVSARRLLERGVGAVLTTLGGSGAVLVTAEGAWFGRAPKITVRSTVGAGDSALSGYLLGSLRGLPERDRVALAVAYGSAAAQLPGTGLPGPDHVDPAGVETSDIHL
ncbi:MULTISPECIES: 1-phosphofructokinase family hexose kinase [Janibacter]|uniref:Hexose kinase n=1 Tax=Janibacter melonis TaxID=262209 RepID=A0A650GEZ7_9MICO|nr:1-phosphofructokinase family hexose kinase [Janibacter melonis]MCB5991641.1 1-phosphofructokinase family hexose kinase [Janibacter melonis]QGX08531.1 hexose kinase [Janibacter melonis]